MRRSALFPMLAILTLMPSCTFVMAQISDLGVSSTTTPKIGLSVDGKHFAQVGSERRFLIWGVNYDHDADGRLIEDYWHEQWQTVEQDFSEIKQLGANVVRIHLQLGKFMRQADQTDETNLKQLQRLVALAEKTGLYLDITGLGCYHRQDIPAWYEALDESDRWQVQARFWEAVARVCQGSSAVFCFNLMNEPIIPGDEKKETDWLAGAFAGKHFVQRIALKLNGRKRDQVVCEWIDLLVTAIRKYDQRTLVTVGDIPWSHVWPGAQPIFYSLQAREKLDFVSIHLYPKRGEVDRAIKAMEPYLFGKPLVIEEMFPLECSIDELDQFVEKSRDSCDGWIGFYWGKQEAEYRAQATSAADRLIADWLKFFTSKRDSIFRD